MPQWLSSLYYATDCTAEILQNSRNQKAIVLPNIEVEYGFWDILLMLLQNKIFIIISNCVAVVLLFTILLLNYKKHSKNYALKLFCWNYIGIQFILCSISIFDLIYQFIWNIIWDVNVICLMSEYERPPKISRPPMLVFPRWYYAVSNIQGFINSSVYYYILPLLLGFQRLNVYLACSFPFFYKIYFKDATLKYYYILIEFFGFLIFGIFFFRSDFPFEYYYTDVTLILIQLLSCLLHIILTLLAIWILFKFKKSQNQTSLEIKGFLYFSILPMLLSLILLMLNTAYLTLLMSTINDPENELIYNLFQLEEKIKMVIERLIIVLGPILDCALMFLCMPTYRNVIVQKLPCLKKNNVTVVKIQNSNSVSSKISFTSQNVAVTHK